MFGFSFLNPALARSIYEAAKYGDLAAIQQSLKEDKADINKRDFRGYTPLHYASKHEQPLAVEFLLKNGAAVDLASFYGFTSLHLASISGSLRVIPILIRNKANVNAKDNSGYTPLHYASSIYGQLEIVIMLVENGADINARTVGFLEGHTPLKFAMRTGNKAVVKYLKSKGATE